MLARYKQKRDFSRTPEPPARISRTNRKPIFVVQEHHASRLHYDFRLEADGVLKSWAVPKKPTLDPSVKRLAVEVEDHPLGYATFSGEIPEGQYGAGRVSIWDEGTYENLLANKSPSKTVSEAIRDGQVEVRLHGRRLKGSFVLVRMNGTDKRKNWLLIRIKEKSAKRVDKAEAQSGSALERKKRGERRVA